MAQEFQGSKLKCSMWGIASGDGLHVATGTHGAVVISRKDGPWTGRLLDGKPLLMATAIANGRDIFIAGSTGGFVNGKALILRSRGAGKSFETSISGTGTKIYELKFHNRTLVMLPVSMEHSADDRWQRPGSELPPASNQSFGRYTFSTDRSRRSLLPNDFERLGRSAEGGVPILAELQVLTDF